MKRKKGKNSRIRLWLLRQSAHILRSSAIISLFCYISFFIFLFCADGFYGTLNTIVTGILGKDNHFSGDTWFSIVASSITSLPGIFCGVLALLQTARLHQLESRYHRPSMGLQEAEMKVTWIRDRQYNGITTDYRRDKFVRRALGKDPEQTRSNLMTFNLDLEIKNDEFVFRHEAYTVSFCDLPDEWKQYRRCEPDYSKGRYLFHIRWELFPYSIEGSRDNVNTEEKDTETRFWESIEQFTNYENRLDKDYYSLLTKVIVNVYYEYAPVKYETAVGTISWTADDGAGRHGAEARRITHSGIFTYRDTV